MTGSCPKHMILGPCGGVRADGGCEVVADPCVFPVPAQWTDSPVADPDPVAAGLAGAAREASALLGIPGVAGVNISGAAPARGYEFAAQVKAGLAARIREERDHDR